MRLVQISAVGELTLTRFFVQDCPPYAVLSHTFGTDEDEVTYEDLVQGTGFHKAGFKKIRFCAEQAVIDGLHHIWVDTCCIDSRNSSEVTESINSMFRWFQNAAKCYVYLPDVSANEPEDRTWEESFARSRWFTRAWTLQDLLAPRSVEFFSIQGHFLGDKVSLEQQIHDITGIPVRALLGDPLSSFTTAERMSWSRNRLSLRREDEAYSLLGIFNVNMPLIYGEGRDAAFRRLQEEIRKGLATGSSEPIGMRLLVAGSVPLRLQTIPITDELQYAILSHTWGDDEVSFEDMRIATAEQRKGYSKIKKCCELAHSHGFEFVWVDTCCINKSSSAELQEAICSMHKWYKNASICYVYLDDWSIGGSRSFRSCRWFKRGWTLQELIAPTYVEFYDQNWNEIGTKQSLCDRIAEITSIDRHVLRGANPAERTVAERMSWAASRETTRIEDEAYCLMGLFNVFMPMLYGEGSRAFIRLQEEIIKQTEDYTIFAWKSKADDRSTAHRGIFAHSPAEFATAHWAQNPPGLDHLHIDHHSPPVLTSRGLVLTLPVVRDESRDGAYWAWVACIMSPSGGAVLAAVCIHLQEIQSKSRIFARSSAQSLEHRYGTNLRLFKHETFCVLPSTVDHPAKSGAAEMSEILVHPPLDEDNKIMTRMQTLLDGNAQWLEDKRILEYVRPLQTRRGCVAAIHFDLKGGFVVIVGFNEETPWTTIFNGQSLDSEETLTNLISDLSTTHPSRNAYSPQLYTDRAMTYLFGTHKFVNARIRVGRFQHPGFRRFDLHVTIENHYGRQVIVEKNDARFNDFEGYSRLE